MNIVYGIIGAGVANAPLRRKIEIQNLKTAMQTRGQTLYPRPWIAPAAWVTATAYTVGAVRRNAAGQWYVAASSGTSGATEPTHTSGNAVTDGGVLWTHLGAAPADPATDTVAPTVVVTGSASVPAGLNRLETWTYRQFYTVRGGTAIQYPATNRMRINRFDRSSGSTVNGKSSVAFWTDAVKIGLEVLIGSLGIVVFVDGRPVQMGAISPNPAGNHWTTIEWIDRRPRLYEIYFDKDNANFFDVAVSATDEIWPDTQPIALKGALISDSFGDGSAFGPFLGGNSYAECLGRLTGIPDMLDMSTGGTGLINAGSGPYYTFVQRVPQLLARAPDVINVHGSVNDNASTQAAVKAAALTFIDTIRAGSTAPIFWLGPMPLSGSYAGIGTVDAGIAEAVGERSTARVYYQSAYTTVPPYLLGSHNNAGAFAAFNNSTNRYIGGDNVHPPDKGTRYIAERHARFYAQTLNTL